MRKKRTRIQSKKRATKLASALAEINTRYTDVFKRLGSTAEVTPEFEKAVEELLKRRAKVYRKLAE